MILNSLGQLIKVFHSNKTYFDLSHSIREFKYSNSIMLSYNTL